MAFAPRRDWWQIYGNARRRGASRIYGLERSTVASMAPLTTVARGARRLVRSRGFARAVARARVRLQQQRRARRVLIRQNARLPRSVMRNISSFM